MKKFFATMLLMATTMTMMAVPAKKGVWKTLKLQDGTEVKAQLVGDEHGHFWVAEDGKAYAVGDRVKYNGLLYRCVQAHTSQADWTPDVVPALWVRTSTEEWPEWIQPTGAHDAYNKGDKVSHNEKHWVSDIDANVYEPGVYGWTEQ